MQTKLQYFLRLLAILLINLCVVAMVGYAYYSRDARQSVPALSKVGSRGEEVRQIQEALLEQGYDPGSTDGVYGNSTAEAVRAFQQDNGLSADGIAGSATLEALGIGGNQSSSRQQDSANTQPATAGDSLSGVYREGDEGDGVRQIQQVLADLGYYTGSVDGQFGSGTTHAVKAFQRNKGLSADGAVGASTLKALGLGESPLSGGLSDSDYQLLARLVSAESRGEPYEGQVAVAAVILNRMEHPSFPDTIPGIAYQSGEFSAINDGQINEAVAESAYRAAKDALNGSDPSGGAIYYYNPQKTNNQWIRTRPVIKTIGAHIFCS